MTLPRRTQKSKRSTPGRLATACFVWVAASAAAGPLTEREKIERLIERVESSDIVFIRNDSEYTGREAAQHLREKWMHVRDSIATASEFIDKIGSASYLSGKPYRVRQEDGREVDSRAWSIETLAQIEQENREQPTPRQVPSAAPAPSEPPTPGSVDGVGDVLSILRESSLWFIRYEDDEEEERSGEDMARHVSLKYVLDGSPELSADEFIVRYCTRSWIHATEYRVRLEEGRTAPLGDWLREQVSRRRAG